MRSRLHSTVARAADNSPFLQSLLNLFNLRSKTRSLISVSDVTPSTEATTSSTDSTLSSTIIDIPSITRDVDACYYSKSIPERPKRDKETGSPAPSPHPCYAYYVNRYSFPTSCLHIGAHVLLVITVNIDTIMAVAIVKGFAPQNSESHYLAYAHVHTCFYPSIHSTVDPIGCSDEPFYRRSFLPRFADRLVPLFVPYDEHDASVCEPMPHSIRAWSIVSIADWKPPIRAIAHLSASSFYPDALRPYLIAEQDLGLPSKSSPPTMFPIPVYGRLNREMDDEAEALPYENRLIPEIGFR